MQTIQEIYDAKIEAGEIKPDEAQARAVEALDRLAQDITHSMTAKKGSPNKVLRYVKLKVRRRRGSNPKERKGEPAIQGLYFHGGVGRGKSMLMDLFFEAVPLKQKRRVHFHEFMLELHDFLHTKRQEQEADNMDAHLIRFADQVAKQSQLLCFDEFQVTDVADAMLLGRLFTALFERGVVTIITSNCTPDQLYAGGLQRDRFVPFIELLKQKLEIVGFDGDTDYRLKRVREMGTYFWPHDKDAQKTIAEEFEQLTDGAEMESHIFHIKGRELTIPRAAKNVAWFTFDELCGEAKSALDYLEIAHRYNTIILENIPKLDDDIRNETKRLITLIDALYENHTRLIVTATAAPDNLYQGDENAFAFDRTISRLMEMQSRDYWE